MTWIPVQQALDWDNSTASTSDGCPAMGQSGAVIQRDWLSLGRGDSTGQWWGVEGEEKWLWKEKSSGKLAICRDVGLFSLVLDGSPMKTVVLKRRNHQIPAPCVSQQSDQQQDAQLLGWEVAVCTLPYLPSTLFQFKAVFNHSREFLE